MSLSDKLARIKLLLLDVDGVLTDGHITYTDSGEEIKTFSVHDGLGIRLLMDAGIRVAIVTGRAAPALRHRCQNLGIEWLYDGVGDKAALLPSILDRAGVRAEETAFMGDDLPDVPMLRRVGLAVTVPAAPGEVKHCVDMVTKAPGGRGAVRELCIAILEAQGLWNNILERFEACPSNAAEIQNG